MARKRGFKTDSELLKENNELCKANKVLKQEISSLKKIIVQLKSDLAAKEVKPEIVEEKCVACQSPDIFTMPHPISGNLRVCKNCKHRERL